ncbi:MAG: hypothetical protein KAJ29_07115 [Alphaproteobacteria bacterium]|nr:hypothetical protein [Alphaproteobacteria bacterium]
MDLTPEQSKSRHRKIDKTALRKHVEQNPDILLCKWAEPFGVHESSMSRALSKRKIRKKKSGAI